MVRREALRRLRRPCILTKENIKAMWIILLLPFIGLLWVPFYNQAEPSLLGFPFFYWYQLLWVPVTAFLTWLVFRHYHKGSEE